LRLGAHKVVGMSTCKAGRRAGACARLQLKLLAGKSRPR